MRILPALLALWAASVLGQERISPEEVKAAFLYHFTAFVEWPASAPRDTFVIAIAGAPEVAGHCAGWRPAAK